jgi:hypothetical protein
MLSPDRQRNTNQICAISGAKFPHDPDTATFERPRAYLHPDGARLFEQALARSRPLFRLISPT